MSAEESKAFERRFFDEFMNKGNLALLDELLTPDFVDHSTFPGFAPDREGEKQMWATFFPAFPDFHSTLEDTVAEGDKVATRFTARGTHKGEYMGIPPTGKRVTVTGIAIHRIKGGKMAENWANIDMLGMLQQLGVAPVPGQAGG